MAEQTAQPTQQQPTQQPTQQPQEPADPFAGFQSEEYNAGELVESAVETPEPKDKSEGEQTPPAKEGEPEPPAKEGEPEPPATTGDPAPPKKKTANERINEITRLRRDAERVAEAEKARADKAERELQEFRARFGTQPPKKEEPAPAARAAAEPQEDPNAPKPDDFEYGEIDPRYIRALTSYEANKAFNELRAKDNADREARELTAKQTAAQAQFETLVERGSKQQADFYEKVVIGSEKGEWALSETLGELALASEVGNEILYHLASNPQEADQVYRSSPLEQARYFGRLEAKLSAGQAAAPGPETGKPAPKLPKAPPPPDAARGAGGQFHATADTEDFLAFERMANTGS